jgi:hypothetical protein
MILLSKSSADARMIDRAVFDANGNADFTDDPILTLNPKKTINVKYQPDEREAVDCRLYLVKSKQSGQWDVTLPPKLWREGTITPISPACGPLMGFLNDLHRESKF